VDITRSDVENVALAMTWAAVQAIHVRVSAIDEMRDDLTKSA
jgi:hypothetical protein